MRARVFLRRRTLDRLLAAGAEPAWDPELAIRAAQIIVAKRRRALSETLEAAVRDAHRPPLWSAAVPVARGAVRRAAPELLGLAESLVETAVPTAEGVALADQLVRDPNSPLYAPGDHHALRAAARIAHRALKCQSDPSEETA